MITPYDISTVVSRSYITEQVQDSMQKGIMLKGEAFLAEYQKEYEKKKNEVAKTEKSSASLVCDKSVKMEEDTKKKKKRHYHKKQGYLTPRQILKEEYLEEHSQGIDIQA